MRFRLFQYPLPAPTELDDLNAFVASQRIATVTHHLVQTPGGGMLVFVVETAGCSAPKAVPPAGPIHPIGMEAISPGLREASYPGKSVPFLSPTPTGLQRHRNRFENLESMKAGKGETSVRYRLSRSTLRRAGRVCPEVAVRRSAVLQTAVSPSSTRQGVGKTRRARRPQRLRIPDPRYSRVQLGATSADVDGTFDGPGAGKTGSRVLFLLSCFPDWNHLDLFA